MSDENTIRILVVDDHHITRVGLIGIITTQPDMTVVGEACSGQQAVDMFRVHKPDVTLMDLRMPGMSGVDAIVKIRTDFPSARIIVLTSYDGDEDIYRALQTGARGYFLKDLRGEELIESIRAVHQGQRRIPPVVASRLADRVPRSDLTPREMDILRLIIDGMSNKLIGSRLGITEGTVKAHVTSILGKLGVSDRTQAATSALQRGIIHLE